VEGAHEVGIDGPEMERRENEERRKGKTAVVSQWGRDILKFEKIRTREKGYIPRCCRCKCNDRCR